MKLKYTKFQMILEALGAAALVGMWGYVLLKWNTVPEKIPMHYNALGEIDRWGGKNEMVVLPIIGLLLYALLTVVIFFPSIWNVPGKVTEENRERVYGSMKSMLVLMKAEMVVCFFYITYAVINAQSLSSWFLPIMLGAIVGTLVFFIVAAAKNAKSKE